MEFAGSLGDLGTLIPLSVALIVITGLNATTVLLMAGLFYIGTGLYYKLPIPVQPLKVVSAVAIAFPDKITLPVMAAAGILFGVILLLLSFTGAIDRIAKFFPKPIVRGIQVGLGLILLSKGISFITEPELLIRGGALITLAGVSLNLIIGIVAGILALVLISSRRFPAALVVVAGGLVIGILAGSLKDAAFAFGPTPMQLYIPSFSDFTGALVLLVIPQIPLTIGNAVMGTADTCLSLFGEKACREKANYRAFAASMGLVNIPVGLLGGMPMCHGSGGLAAHYRFGARTGGANLMIGIIFVLIALLFGKIAVNLLTCLPNSIMGVLLVFAGIELALLIRDVTEKNDLFLVFLIAGVGLATTNMGIAFFTGILTMHLMRCRNIEI